MENTRKKIPLINCEINLILIRPENYVRINEATRDADPDADPVVTPVNKCMNQLLLYQIKMITN